MTIGPAPMIRIVERSVRFGIALPAKLDQAQKKRRPSAAPVNFPRPADDYPSRRAEPYPIISGEGRAWRARPNGEWRPIGSGHSEQQFQRAAVCPARGPI